MLLGSKMLILLGLIVIKFSVVSQGACPLYYRQSVSTKIITDLQKLYYRLVNV